MENRDVIEFYCDDKLIGKVRSSMPPNVGDKISIRQKTFEVINKTYALDHADSFAERCMRANIDLKLIPE
jgi:hypothetical protein